MNLEGSLDSFSLQDIFQLLTFTKKTGGLHLAQGGSDGVVFFGGGQITGASADSSRQPLARRLIGAGVVDDEALVAAVGTASSSPDVGVAKALLDNGSIDGAMVRQAVGDQTLDAVFDLLRWRDGDFAFVVDEANPDDVGVTLPVTSVVSDADARAASWEAVSELVPSLQTVLAMPIVLPGDPQVSREEWSLLAFVDGRRTVGELVDLTGSGQYAVVSLLAGLVRRGLLEVREDDHTDHVGVVLRRQALLAPLEGVPFTPSLATRHADAAPEPPVAPVRSAEPTPPAEREPVDAGTAPDPSEPAEHEHHAEPATDVPGFVPATATAEDGPGMLGGAHLAGDVLPARPEPFLPRRQVDFDEGTPSSTPGRPLPGQGGSGGTIGATAVAIDPEVAAVIERDPNVNRSLMLRLIAGVRGL